MLLSLTQRDARRHEMNCSFLLVLKGYQDSVNHDAGYAQRRDTGLRPGARPYRRIRGPRGYTCLPSSNQPAVHGNSTEQESGARFTTAFARVRELPVGNWLYEVKFDGYRALAIKAEKEVRLLSRNQTNFNNDYPQLIDALERLKAKSFIIDGEIAALDSEGKVSFQLLQSYKIGKQPPLVYYAFDLLSLEGTDLRSRPLIERHKLLAKLLEKAPDSIRCSEELRSNREELLQAAQQFQLEGLVAKRPDSVYESGRRSGAWVKVKVTQEQEFVIGGYTPPEGSRRCFGTLLVGYQSPTGLLFAGRVGTGFSEKVLADLYHGLQKIRRPTCPFVNLPEKRRGRWAKASLPQS
jgi:bifunctional non-homologous end joining protein LigD